MTAYNKLKIAILAIIASQNIHAITIDPIQIQSAPGELLYAEMNFRQADPNTKIEAGLASAEDVMTLGAVHQPPGHLNFFTRHDNAGNGVITITSSRPLTQAELNVIVKVKQGNTTRLQHVKTSLTRNNNKPAQPRTVGNEKVLAPILIASEKDIGLQLPESTQYQVQVEQLPLESFEAPLTSGMTTATLVNTYLSQQANRFSAQQQSASTIISADPLAKKYAQLNAQKPIQAKTTNKAIESTAKSDSNKTQHQPAHSNVEGKITQHKVQPNESLWAIASRVAAEQNRSVAEVMNQIKANNQHAFIQGDMNRLRRGAALNLNTANQPKPAKVSPAAAATQASSAQSGKAKYRLNQAEMSLVAQKEQDSASGSAKKNTEKNQTSNELSLKVMTSREKTVKLQKNVTQLEVALQQKDHRIQLLNTRLAQLQQQLKAQQVEKKPTH